MKPYHLVHEGSVTSRSGKLMVIDPCYLVGFDTGPADEHDERVSTNHIGRTLHELAVHSVQRRQRAAERRSRWGLPSVPEEESAPLLELLAEPVEDSLPYLSPPYLGQFPYSVLIRSSSGDSTYPVVMEQGRVQILLDYPLNEHRAVDVEAIGRPILGYSHVDSTCMVLIDPIGTLVHPDTEPDSYCVFPVPRGEYRCMFGIQHKLHIYPASESPMDYIGARLSALLENASDERPA